MESIIVFNPEDCFKKNSVVLHQKNSFSNPLAGPSIKTIWKAFLVIFLFFQLTEYFVAIITFAWIFLTKKYPEKLFSKVFN